MCVVPHYGQGRDVARPVGDAVEKCVQKLHVVVGERAVEEDGPIDSLTLLTNRVQRAVSSGC